MSEPAIARLQHALIKTGLLSQQSIDQITSGELTEAEIEAMIANLKSDMHPTKPKLANRYVLGFVFNRDTYTNRVLLIHKNRPAWQKGRLNGIGGKIEGTETPLQAMEREFREETGFIQRLRTKDDEVDTIQWQYVGRRHRPAQFDNQPEAYEMFVYAAWWDDVQQLVAGDHSSRGVDSRYHGHVYSWEKNIPTDEPVVAAELDRNYLSKFGVPGLVWTMDAALCSLKENFHFEVEDPMSLEHIDG